MSNTPKWAFGFWERSARSIGVTSLFGRFCDNKYSSKWHLFASALDKNNNTPTVTVRACVCVVCSHPYLKLVLWPMFTFYAHHICCRLRSKAYTHLAECSSKLRRWHQTSTHWFRMPAGKHTKMCCHSWSMASFLYRHHVLFIAFHISLMSFVHLSIATYLGRFSHIFASISIAIILVRNYFPSFANLVFIGNAHEPKMKQKIDETDTHQVWQKADWSIEKLLFGRLCLGTIEHAFDTLSEILSTLAYLQNCPIERWQHVIRNKHAFCNEMHRVRAHLIPRRSKNNTYQIKIESYNCRCNCTTARLSECGK